MNQESVEKFEGIVQGIIDEGRLPGVAFAIADRDGIVYDRSFGVADIATGKVVTGDTEYFAASFMKLITATAAMQLVEKGVLDLDANVGEYVKDFDDPLVIESFDDGVPVLRKAKRKMTLRQLMSNTSGYGDGQWNVKRRLWNEKFRVGFDGWNTRTAPLVWDPGDGWLYCTSHDLVMEIIMAVAGDGMTWDEYVRKNVVEPLGMDSTVFFLTEKMKERKSQIHFLRPGNKLLSNTVLDNRKALSWYGEYNEHAGDEGSGGIWTTAHDWTRIMRMILNGGELDGVRVLQPESVEEMRKNQTGEHYVHWADNGTGVSGFASDCDFFFGTQKAHWGLGAMVNLEDSVDGRGANSLSWFGGANTFYYTDPKNGVCACLMTNLRPGATEEMMGLWRNFERISHGLPLVEMPDPTHQYLEDQWW